MITVDDLRINWSVRDHSSEDEIASVFASIWLKTDKAASKPRAHCEVMIPFKVVDDLTSLSDVIPFALERLQIDITEMNEGGNPQLAEALGL